MARDQRQDHREGLAAARALRAVRKGLRFAALLLPSLLISTRALAAPFEVLVVIVDFADAAAPADIRYIDDGVHFVPLSIANAETVFLSGSPSTAALYDELSFGEVEISGDVARVALAANIGSSDFSTWKALADTEVANQGYVLGNYDRVGYILSYGFSGQMSAGNASPTNDWFWATSANPSSSFLNERVFSHELGHSFGLEHAAEIQPDGSIADQGDLTDFMGSGERVHSNAPNKFLAGWLPSPKLTEHPFDGGTTYLFRSLVDPFPGIQVIRVDSHGAHPDLGAPVDTYISFRAPFGFDDNIPIASDAYGTPVRNTAHIHHRRKDGKLLNYFDRALDLNQPYTFNGTTIEVIGKIASFAYITVSQEEYFPTPSTLVIDPVSTDQGFGGSLLEYEIDVSNHDGVNYPAYYEADATLPGPGWSFAWDVEPKEILVDAGATETITGLRITSPMGAAPGIYDIPFTLTNSGGSGAPVESASTLRYEVLDSGDTTPPPAPSGLFGNAFPGSGDDYVVLQWTEPADLSDIVVYQPYRNGVALPTPATRQAIYVDFFYSELESNAYVVRSVDMAANESAASNVFTIGVPDTVAPGPPSELSGEDQGSEVELSWSAASDNVWVASYEIHRDGLLYGTSDATHFVDSSPPAAGAVYSVIAVDAWGNRSPRGNLWGFGGPAVPALPVLSFLGATALLVGAGGWHFLRAPQPRRRGAAARGKEQDVDELC